MRLLRDDDDVDRFLSRAIRPGDTVWVGQGPAEPLPLTQALVRQARALAPLRSFVGLLTSDTFATANEAGMTFLSYGAVAKARALHACGALDVLPTPYSQFPALIANGTMPCDVVLLQLSAEGPDGRPSFGLAHDYLLAAAQRARLVVAEINDRMPWTYGSEALAGLRIDAMLRTSRPVPELAQGVAGAIERRIAAGAAAYIEDGCTLELGIGGVPDAILQAVADRRDLGIHGGLIGDGVVDLMERGVITNAHKAIDAGRTTAGMLFGSLRAQHFARENAALNLCAPEQTHGSRNLARLGRFIAVNSALEVDLGGQVNAETAAGRYVGAVGGQADFVRAALVADGGRSIIALPATTSDGRTSRIVARLTDATATTPRSDADVFATEWGVAELRGQPLAERARRMIAITHPAHREQLEREARL